MRPRSFLSLALIAWPVLGVGCDGAARQQEARQARSQQVDELKAQGEAMQRQGEASATRPAGADAPKSVDPPG